jgi:hypothetical protein
MKLKEKEIAMREKLNHMREGSRQWLDQKRRIAAVMMKRIGVR